MASIVKMNHLTTNTNKHIEREYDEYKGMPIYGWTIKQKQPQYKQQIGLLKDPPKYRNAGSRWKYILSERYDQRSFHGSDDTPLEEFNGTFHLL